MKTRKGRSTPRPLDTKNTMHLVLRSSKAIGNHLHFQIKLANRFSYKPFIRAITAAIAMAITGASRWNPLKTKGGDRFWDYRPFTRVVQGFKAFLTLRDYIMLNQIEGAGESRVSAQFILAASQDRRARVGSG